MNNPELKPDPGTSRSGTPRYFECQVRSRETPGASKIVSMTAPSKEEAIQRLLTQGYVVVSVKQVKEGMHSFRDVLGGQSQRSLMRAFSFSIMNRVSSRELIFFASQLSTLLKAGIPLLRALEIIWKGTRNAFFRTLLQRIRKRISEGTSFAAALREAGNVFPWVWINLVEVGEATGKLPDCLDEIAQYQESASRIKSKVITAFFYPGVLTVAVVAALAFLLTFIVPKFATIFMEQNMELPTLTKIVLLLSSIVRNQFIYVVLLVFAASIGIIMMKRSPRYSIALDALWLGVPIFGELSMQVAVVRFSRALGTLLRAGVQILQALEIGGRLVENKFLEGHIKQVAQAVKGGQGLGIQLEARKVFPVFMTQLLTTGEESGQMDRFLTLIADYYEDNVDTFLARLTVLLEPVLLVFMGVVIGVVVVSMFLPIIELASGAHIK